MSPHISIKGEVVFNLLGFPVTNSFLTTILVIIVFVFIARYYYRQIHRSNRSLFFYVLHGLFTGIYGMIESVLQDKTKIFYPLLGAFFFFILLSNWSGLIPGVGSLLITPFTHTTKHFVPLLRGGTADLNTTLALALVSVFMTQLYGFRFLGPARHLKKYFDFRDPVMIMLGPLEIVQEFARIVSFGFRLYGNIFAGEVLLTIVPFLLPVFLSFIVAPMFLMELFVGAVQALVFVMLSSVFINMAVTEHH